MGGEQPRAAGAIQPITAESRARRPGPTLRGAPSITPDRIPGV